MSDAFGNIGRLPGVSPQSPVPASQPSQAGQAGDVTEVARTVLMDPELSPYVMCDRFWRLREQHLREVYGIAIEK